MSLNNYSQKRDFKKTNEPQGKTGDKGGQRFVVQRHDASNLHFDLRLEINGVLKSWAVPKGPSMQAKTKRLAIQTEDHPISYLTFEGRIPEGNYGAGTVDIWDKGTFKTRGTSKNKSSSLQKWKDGNLKVIFKGAKLKGEFALVKTGRQQKDDHWLLIKKGDSYSTDTAYDAEDHSEAKLNRKSSDRGDSFIKPMLATPKSKIFNDAEWIYEMKWDGYRMIAAVDNGDVKCFSRNGESFTKKFKKITRALGDIPQQAILDGEVVALDKKGIPSFQGLQNYPEEKWGELRYYVFDLLFLNGHSTRDLKLTERKSLIPDVIQGSEGVYYCDHVEGMGTAYYKKAVDAAIEGVVAKKMDSKYKPGDRSEDWLKIKAEDSQEAVICGYTESDADTAFGSLILGIYQEKELTYIGNCGTGFSQNEKGKLRKKFKALQRKTSPFPDDIDLKGRTPHWLTPKLIAEVNFTEWTEDKKMRHPSFKGLRRDKEAGDIHKQTPLEENPDSSSSTSRENRLEIEGNSVPFTNLDKEFWPKSGLRKYDLIDYYLKIAETLVPYLKDRPQSLLRHPDGIGKKGFFQKDISEKITKPWMETVRISAESKSKKLNYLLCQNTATLLYMANLGCIELNAWNSRIKQLDYPDYAVIDLDPSDKNSFDDVIEVAQGFKGLFDDLGITGYCKTSGSSGLHIFLPLAANYTYDEARDFTKLLCSQIQGERSKLTTLERQKDKRHGRIYLDYLQNRKGQTIAAPYCVRPKEGAPVSVPLAWAEVKKGLKIKDFTLKNMPKRLSQKGDLFEGVLQKGLDMEAVLNKVKG